jgi:hypothetical protein
VVVAEAVVVTVEAVEVAEAEAEVVEVVEVAVEVVVVVAVVDYILTCHNYIQIQNMNCLKNMHDHPLMSHFHYEEILIHLIN